VIQNLASYPLSQEEDLESIENEIDTALVSIEGVFFTLSICKWKSRCMLHYHTAIILIITDTFAYECMHVILQGDFKESYININRQARSIYRRLPVYGLDEVPRDSAVSCRAYCNKIYVKFLKNSLYYQACIGICASMNT
jgi:hypothetical protein